MSIIGYLVYLFAVFPIALFIAFAGQLVVMLLALPVKAIAHVIRLNPELTLRCERVVMCVGIGLVMAVAFFLPAIAVAKFFPVNPKVILGFVFFFFVLWYKNGGDRFKEYRMPLLEAFVGVCSSVVLFKVYFH